MAPALNSDPRVVLRAPARPSRHAAVAARLGIVLCLGGLLLPTPGCMSNTRKPNPLANRYPTLPAKEVPEYLKGSIFERVDVHNTEPLNVNNFGLVVNLPETGDALQVRMSVRDYVIKQMLKNGFGSSRTIGFENVQPEQVLKDPRVAIVRVDALVPPGAREGQPLDIQVSALPNTNTTSLAGGSLYRTDLMVNGYNPEYPGVAIDVIARGEGPIFVNPAYALVDPATDRAARASLRYGVVLGGGEVKQDRPIALRLRAPELRTTATIANRVNQFYADSSVAKPKDEAFVFLYMPQRFNGNWEHFLGVTTHLYSNTTPEFAIAKARQLVAEAEKPDAALMDISYCWEGLGPGILPVITPLLTHPSPDVAFAAARAAVFLGDAGAVAALATMARTDDHPFQITAVQTLGSLQNSPAINQVLRSLLESTSASVRIEAYRILADAGDSSIYSQKIGGGRFILDIVPSRAPSMIYASRRGSPRIAVFGNKPVVQTPVLFSSLGNRFTLTGSAGERTVRLFYRDPTIDRPQVILSNPDIAEIIARLGGEGPDGAPQRLPFSFGEVVALVQAMSDKQMIVSPPAPGQATSNGAVASASTGRTPTPFVLQEVPRVQDEIDSAPPIPERGRPTGADDAPQASGQPAGAVESTVGGRPTGADAPGAIPATQPSAARSGG